MTRTSSRCVGSRYGMGCRRTATTTSTWRSTWFSRTGRWRTCGRATPAGNRSATTSAPRTSAATWRSSTGSAVSGWVAGHSGATNRARSTRKPAAAPKHDTNNNTRTGRCRAVGASCPRRGGPNSQPPCGRPRRPGSGWRGGCGAARWRRPMRRSSCAASATTACWCVHGSPAAPRTLSRATGSRYGPGSVSVRSGSAAAPSAAT